MEIAIDARNAQEMGAPPDEEVTKLLQAVLGMTTPLPQGPCRNGNTVYDSMLRVHHGFAQLTADAAKTQLTVLAEARFERMPGDQPLAPASAHSDPSSSARCVRVTGRWLQRPGLTHVALETRQEAKVLFAAKDIAGLAHTLHLLEEKKNLATQKLDELFSWSKVVKQCRNFRDRCGTTTAFHVGSTMVSQDLQTVLADEDLHARAAKLRECNRLKIAVSSVHSGSDPAVLLNDAGLRADLVTCEQKRAKAEAMLNAGDDGYGKPLSKFLEESLRRQTNRLPLIEAKLKQMEDLEFDVDEWVMQSKAVDEDLKDVDVAGEPETAWWLNLAQGVDEGGLEQRKVFVRYFSETYDAANDEPAEVTIEDCWPPGSTRPASVVGSDVTVVTDVPTGSGSGLSVGGEEVPSTSEAQASAV